ncbi:MAG: DUF3987 domain-containing protein [Deltaproteobacteria bacterium]|nr:DUF3987 domain-containing protein [Deltaproteobacteria bacterium]
MTVAIRSSLEDVITTGPNTFEARCPVHGESVPARLVLTVHPDGTEEIRCPAGCGAEQIRKVAAARQASANLLAAPPFPLATLPPWLQEHVESVAFRLEVDPALPAALSLAVVSAAVGARYRVRAWQAFEQPLHWWTTIILGSGDSKSPCFHVMRRPLDDYQQERQRKEAPALEEAGRRFQVLAAKAAKAKRDAAAGKASEEDAVAALRTADEARPPLPFKLLLGHVSGTELLEKELVDHGFLAHIRDEADFIKDILGRYGKREGRIDSVLAGYDGSSIDSATLSRGQQRRERVGLVLALLTQPETYKRDAGESSFDGRGFLERMVPVWPRGTAGGREMNMREGNRGAEERYAGHIKTLSALGHEPEEGAAPRVLRLDSDAIEVFVAFRQRIEPRHRGDLEPLSSFLSKTQGGVAPRLAGLLALAWRHEAAEVNGDDMERAVHLVEQFFIPHAQRVAGLNGGAFLYKRERVLKWARGRDGKVFLPRDLQRAHGGLFESADDARALLEELAEDGVMIRTTRRGKDNRALPDGFFLSEAS